MAHCDCNGIGGIEFFGKFLYFQQFLQHCGYLFLRGGTIASDCQLYLSRCIFKYRYCALKSRCDGCTLSSSQFQHRLHVFALERRLNCNFVGMKSVNKLCRALEDVFQFGEMVVHLAHIYNTEGYYVLVNFESEATLPREIERTMQIAESILRYLIVKVEEKRSNVKPRPERKAPEAEEEIPAAEALEAAEEAPVAEPTEE